jgi:hypothetical protein
MQLDQNILKVLQFLKLSSIASYFLTATNKKFVFVAILEWFGWSDWSRWLIVPRGQDRAEMTETGWPCVWSCNRARTLVKNAVSESSLYIEFYDISLYSSISDGIIIHLRCTTSSSTAWVNVISPSLNDSLNSGSLRYFVPQRTMWTRWKFYILLHMCVGAWGQKTALDTPFNVRFLRAFRNWSFNAFGMCNERDIREIQKENSSSCIFFEVEE